LRRHRKSDLRTAEPALRVQLARRAAVRALGLRAAAAPARSGSSAAAAARAAICAPVLACHRRRAEHGFERNSHAVSIRSG
jgi:hypothetical protein